MISLDAFLDRRKTPTYKCFDHAAEVWEHLTGEKLRTRVSSYVESGHLSLSDARGFTQINVPTSPCLVLMENTGDDEPHLGVFFERKVMHLATHGAEFQPLHVATFGFKKVRFYK